MNAILRYRIAITLICAVVLIVVTAVLRGPDDAQAMHAELFWANKLTWNGCADLVIAGDSRTCRDIAPAVVESVLPGLRVLNYAFDSTGFSRRYLDTIPGVLDPESPDRIIVLGITPFSLTRTATEAGEFDTSRERLLFQSMTGLYAAESLRFLRPMRVDEIPGEFGAALRDDRRPAQTDREFFSDGWLARSRPPGGFGASLRRHQEIFEATSVDAQLTAELVNEVKKWSEAGICVFAFRPPCCPELLQIENRCSGFEEAAFVAAFRRAGGIWIPVDPTGFETYDGSHLRRDEAVRFSRVLASRIQEWLFLATSVATSDPE